ncbi:hypothetical protein Pelo_2338 [Pelomyxa schiedti]|nr:hypothetical protein Pelo_2338 [Pelomyxa schiedti]
MATSVSNTTTSAAAESNLALSTTKPKDRVRRTPLQADSVPPPKVEPTPGWETAPSRVSFQCELLGKLFEYLGFKGKLVDLTVEKQKGADGSDAWGVKISLLSLFVERSEVTPDVKQPSPGEALIEDSPPPGKPAVYVEAYTDMVSSSTSSDVSRSTHLRLVCTDLQLGNFVHALSEKLPESLSFLNRIAATIVDIVVSLDVEFSLNSTSSKNLDFEWHLNAFKVTAGNWLYIEKIEVGSGNPPSDTAAVISRSKYLFTAYISIRMGSIEDFIGNTLNMPSAAEILRKVTRNAILKLEPTTCFTLETTFGVGGASTLDIAELIVEVSHITFLGLPLSVASRYGHDGLNQKNLFLALVKPDDYRDVTTICTIVQTFHSLANAPDYVMKLLQKFELRKYSCFLLLQETRKSDSDPPPSTPSTEVTPQTALASLLACSLRFDLTVLYKGEKEIKAKANVSHHRSRTSVVIDFQNLTFGTVMKEIFGSDFKLPGEIDISLKHFEWIFGDPLSEEELAMHPWPFPVKTTTPTNGAVTTTTSTTATSVS